MKIRIIAAPPGEAPLHIREAWIGVVLATRSEKPAQFPSLGVLTGPGNLVGQFVAALRGRVAIEYGYAVNARDAIDTLARSRPDAAAWWRENAPDLLQPQEEFVFAASVCEPAPPPAPASEC
jgi:hypothetical protein